MPKTANKPPKPVPKSESLESWIWDAACSIRGAKDAPKYKDYILPLIFTKRLCDVFDDEVNRIAAEVGSRKKAFQLAKADHKLVRFYLPLVPDDPEQPVWYVIRKFAEGGGQSAGEWSGATWTTRQDCPEGERGGVHQFYTPPEVGTIMSRVLQPEPGSEPDGQLEIYVPTCGSGGLLVKCEIAMEESAQSKKTGKKGAVAPLKLFGQDKSARRQRRFGLAPRDRRVRLRGKQPKQFTPETWAMANMNMIIHDMEGQIEIGDTFKNPKFRTKQGKLRTFDRVVATARRDSASNPAKPDCRASRREDNPMWNQDWFTESDYDYDYDNDTAQRDSADLEIEGKLQSVPEGQDKLDRFPAGAGFPGKSSADWGWVQHMHASLKSEADGQKAGRAAASRGSGNAGTNKEKTVRQWFVDHDLIESVLYLPENLYYNTTAPGIVLFLNRDKPKTRQGKVFLVNASQVFEKDELIEPSDALLTELRGLIVDARQQVAQVANAALTMIYWQIGERIHHEVLGEKRADYGKRIVASVGRQSAAEFKPKGGCA